jgi:hypothetical protein
VAPGGDATLTGVLADLARRGYTESFEVAGSGLHSIAGGKTFRPDELTIRDFYRFEGVSDPDDMSIVYAIEARDGTRGTLVDAFGVYSDPAVGMVLDNIPIRRVVERRP